MLLTNARIYQSRQFIQSSLRIEGSTITAIGENLRPESSEEILDAQNRYLVPGFIDVHTHGGNHIDINHMESIEEIDALSLFYASKGTTSFLASVMTDSTEQTDKILLLLSAAMGKGTLGSQLLGIHLEGPFISREYKGAMPENLLKDGDEALLEHYLQVSGNQVRYLTVAPEVPKVLPLVQAYKDRLVIALGHSGADYETSMEAIALGAKASTHTFNAMKLFHMHQSSITGAALESDIYCEAICDGFHLSPAAVRLLLKTKGYDRVVAITDSMMAAGLGDGTYDLGVNEVHVSNGDAKLANGTRAGSTLTQDKELKNLLQFTGASLEKVLPLLTENPARLLNLFSTKGSLEVGKDADFVLLDTTLEVAYTYVRGNLAYARKGKTL
jgi:N-acetylglucosamine-6-phosphate deacetylase